MSTCHRSRELAKLVLALSRSMSLKTSRKLATSRCELLYLLFPRLSLSLEFRKSSESRECSRIGVASKMTCTQHVFAFAERDFVLPLHSKARLARASWY